MYGGGYIDGPNSSLGISIPDLILAASSGAGNSCKQRGFQGDPGCNEINGAQISGAKEYDFRNQQT
jgi:hypothetical protein